MADPHDFRPRHGSITFVFDVLERNAETVAALTGAGGFEVQRYYRPEREHGPGGSAPGWIRFGAQRPLALFTQAEQDSIAAEFDERLRGVDCERVGTDVSTSGGGAGGVREPRRPHPLARSGAAAAPIPC